MNIFRWIPHIRVRSVVIPRPRCTFTQFTRAMATGSADLNNTSAERARIELAVDSTYDSVSLAIPSSEDDADVRKSYRLFLLDREEAKQD